MTLLRAQIDVLLENMEADARRRHREHPGNPALAQDLVAQARALLRTVELEHHLHICDHVQHLLLTMDVEEREQGRDRERAPVLQPMASTLGGVPGLGIPLVADPYDLDAYGCDDSGQGLREATDDEREADGTVAAVAPRSAAAERRRQAPGAADLRAGLTPAQLATLDTMAVFGWNLEFVRRPMFLPPQPVAFDRNRQRFVVVDVDGKAEEDASVRIRA